ncbi:MAG: alpha/beta hydrolase [Actinomycetota bacterium]
MTDEPHGDPASEQPTEAGGGSPLDRLELLAMQTVAVDEGLDHLELYTMQGLLTVLWHGPTEATDVVVCVGGAMGGLLGPDGGLYHRLGRALSDHGIGVLRVGYRRPNDLSRCVHDMLAAMELAARHGASRFVTVGHSFGGAVAVQAAAHLEARSVPGVVTLATQSAGCEPVELLVDRNLLFVHGTRDQILPHQASELVRMLAGHGELLLLDGADHMLRPSGSTVLARLLDHLPAVFATATDPDGGLGSTGDDAPPPTPPSADDGR